MRTSLHRWRASAVAGLLVGAIAVGIPAVHADDGSGSSDSTSAVVSDGSGAADSTSSPSSVVEEKSTPSTTETTLAADPAPAPAPATTSTDSTPSSKTMTNTATAPSTSTNTVAPASKGQNGTTLSASVTAAAHSRITYGWTIDKSVSPSSIDIFAGDQADATYTVAVTKDSGTAEQWVDGRVCVTNGGAVATEDLAISVGATLPPSKAIIASSPVDLGTDAVLAPGVTACYGYRIDVTGKVSAGESIKVTADITITNHSGHLNTAFGPGPSNEDPATMPTATPTNDSIHVDDSNGMSWSFSDDGSETYTTTFDTAGTFKNTVTIRETGQTSLAFVTVNVHELSVAKTATTSWNRAWSWTIDKSVSPTAMTLAAGQTGSATWTVAVNPTSTDSGHQVSGTITVSNPAPMAATLTSVTDQFGTLRIAVSCPSLSVPANGSLECTYTKDLAAATNGTNTATATQQNYHYTATGAATEAGTTDYTGTAGVTFSANPTNEADECVSLADDLAPAGTFPTSVCADAAVKSFTYSTQVGPYATAGIYTVTNTATFTTNDHGTTGSDDATVTVTVPAGGCTLTQGYWKTHSDNGPAPYDDLWAAYTGKTFFLSGKTWFQVYWTAPAGNAYYNLAHQYMAATMNIANGAGSTPAVDAALAKATAFFQSTSPTAKLTAKQRNEVLQWAALLDQYNNGLVGPGHCSE